MNSKLEITGLDDYFALLQQKEMDINKVARAALDEAAPLIQTEMQKRVAVDEGGLRDHIMIYTPSGEGDFNYRFIGVISKKIFTDKRTAIKAIVNEFGSKHMAAHPYIRPAIRAARLQVQNIIKEHLQRAGMVD